MPTYERLPRFKREFKQLDASLQEQFKTAVREWVADLRQHGIRPNDPRVEGIRRAPGVFEFRWAPDGRATFEWGRERVPGEPHVVWRRIGTHQVLNEP